MNIDGSILRRLVQNDDSLIDELSYEDILRWLKEEPLSNIHRDKLIKLLVYKSYEDNKILDIDSMKLGDKWYYLGYYLAHASNIEDKEMIDRLVSYLSDRMWIKAEDRFLDGFTKNLKYIDVDLIRFLVRRHAFIVIRLSNVPIISTKLLAEGIDEVLNNNNVKLHTIINLISYINFGRSVELISYYFPSFNDGLKYLGDNNYVDLVHKLNKAILNQV